MFGKFILKDSLFRDTRRERILGFEDLAPSWLLEKYETKQTKWCQEQTLLFFRTNAVLGIGRGSEHVFSCLTFIDSLQSSEHKFVEHTGCGSFHLRGGSMLPEADELRTQLKSLPTRWRVFNWSVNDSALS